MKVIILLLLILLFLILFNRKEKFSNTNNKSIIIVGNAPFDKSKKLGKTIDSFSKVVRFNSFKTDEFSEHIGKKIDEWVVSDTHCILLNKMFLKQCKKMPEVKINIVLPEVFKNNTTKLERLVPESILEKCNILIQNRDIIVDGKYNFGRRWPSTGILAIYYYLNLHKKIYITGFNHFDPKEKTIHYYENRQQIGHQHNLEKQIVDDLVKEGKVIRL